MSNLTSTKLNADCIFFSDFPAEVKSLLNLFSTIETYTSLIFLPIIALSLVESTISAIAIIMLRSWKNQAKKYYSLIIGINMISAVYVDLLRILPYILFDVSLTAFGFQGAIRLPNVLDMNIVFCKLGSVLDVWLPALLIWTLTAFNFNRMLILLFPMKAYRIQAIFKTRILIILLALISLFVSHHFYTAFPAGKSGVCNDMIQFSVGNTFWRDYDTFVKLTMITWIPWSILLISNIIIIISMLLHAKQRRQMVVSARTQHVNYSGLKTLVLITTTYFAATIPYLLCEIIKTQFTNCRDKNVVLYSFLEVLISTILKHLWILIRILYPLILYVMVPQFKAKIFQIICVKANNANRQCQ